MENLDSCLMLLSGPTLPSRIRFRIAVAMWVSGRALGVTKAARYVQAPAARKYFRPESNVVRSVGQARHEVGRKEESLKGAAPLRHPLKKGTKKRPAWGGKLRSATTAFPRRPYRSRYQHGTSIHRQVFGLTGLPRFLVVPYWPSLPNPNGVSAFIPHSAQWTAVVPVYRCGAVPDSHTHYTKYSCAGGHTSGFRPVCGFPFSSVRTNWVQTEPMN